MGVHRSPASLPHRVGTTLEASPAGVGDETRVPQRLPSVFNNPPTYYYHY